MRKLMRCIETSADNPEACDGPMHLIKCVPYSNGAVRLVYDTRPAHR